MDASVARTGEEGKAGIAGVTFPSDRIRQKEDNRCRAWISFVGFNKGMKRFLFLSLLCLAGTATEVPALEPGLERKALRAASGLYGPGKPASIPSGQFNGTVGNTYTKEHASMELRLKPGRGKSRAVLNVWDGSDHITRLVRLNTRVKSGGRVVQVSGGRIAGTGLLPLGIELNGVKIAKGKVKVSGGSPSLVATLNLGGIDLANMNAPVSGSAVFRGEQ